MRFKDTINVLCCRDGDKSGGLLDLDAVIIIHEAHVSKRRFVFTWKSKTFADDVIDCFSNVFIRASKGKVINLAKKENFNTTKRC